MPRMPKSWTTTPAGSLLRARRLTTSTPKASSPMKTLPMPATRMRMRGSSGLGVVERLDLVRREEEPVSHLAILAEVAPRIVLDRHGELHDAVHALHDLLDDRGLAVEHEVEGVGPALRPQAHAAAPADVDAVDGRRSPAPGARAAPSSSRPRSVMTRQSEFADRSV